MKGFGDLRESLVDRNAVPQVRWHAGNSLSRGRMVWPRGTGGKRRGSLDVPCSIKRLQSLLLGDHASWLGVALRGIYQVYSAGVGSSWQELVNKPMVLLLVYLRSAPKSILYSSSSGSLCPTNASIPLLPLCRRINHCPSLFVKTPSSLPSPTT